MDARRSPWLYRRPHVQTPSCVSMLGVVIRIPTRFVAFHAASEEPGLSEWPLLRPVILLPLRRPTTVFEERLSNPTSDWASELSRESLPRHLSISKWRGGVHPSSRSAAPRSSVTVRRTMRQMLQPSSRPSTRYPGVTDYLLISHTGRWLKGRFPSVLLTVGGQICGLLHGPLSSGKRFSLVLWWKPPKTNRDVHEQPYSHRSTPFADLQDEENRAFPLTAKCSAFASSLGCMQ
jgi:hypothetical protein